MPILQQVNKEFMQCVMVQRITMKLGGRHITEVELTLLTLPTRVRFLASQDFFSEQFLRKKLLRFNDSRIAESVDNAKA
jgi:hypothetical protein